MKKLNYSSAKHLVKMIGVHAEDLEKRLQAVECSRKAIVSLSDKLLTLLKEAHKEIKDATIKNQKE